MLIVIFRKRLFVYNCYSINNKVKITAPKFFPKYHGSSHPRRNLREINVAAGVARCVPNEVGLLLVAGIGVGDRAALAVGIGVGRLGPGADPLVSLGVPGLQEEALEVAALDPHCGR